MDHEAVRKRATEHPILLKWVRFALKELLWAHEASRLSSLALYEGKMPNGYLSGMMTESAGGWPEIEFEACNPAEDDLVAAILFLSSSATSFSILVDRSMRTGEPFDKDAALSAIAETRIRLQEVEECLSR